MAKHSAWDILEKFHNGGQVERKLQTLIRQYEIELYFRTRKCDLFFHQGKNYTYFMVQNQKGLTDH